jgi:hypothetical protein
VPKRLLGACGPANLLRLKVASRASSARPADPASFIIPPFPCMLINIHVILHRGERLLRLLDGVPHFGWIVGMLGVFRVSCRLAAESFVR